MIEPFYFKDKKVGQLKDFRTFIATRTYINVFHNSESFELDSELLFILKKIGVRKIIVIYEREDENKGIVRKKYEINMENFMEESVCYKDGWNFKRALSLKKFNQPKLGEFFD